ncbi:hypothetical protein ACFL9T_14255 [Thermodesulfobacteriota bacterium]
MLRFCAEEPTGGRKGFCIAFQGPGERFITVPMHSKVIEVCILLEKLMRKKGHG